MRFFSSLLLLSLVPLAPLNCNASDADRAVPQATAVAAAPAVSAPAGSGPAAQVRIRLAVKETSGVARRGEVLRSGVPLPRSLDVRDPARLAVVDADGKPVPAQFEVLARWNAGLSAQEAPIQWLLVIFPATVGARASAGYSLVTGANPAPPRQLELVRDGDRVTVDTGAAVFHLGQPGALFSEIRLGDGKRLVTGGGMSVSTGERTSGHPTLRRVWVEHAGPLSAAVVVDGAYDAPPVGEGGIGSRRRYLFTAGSPTVLVRHAVAWEGNLGCRGCIQTKDGQPNGVRIDRVRDVLALDLEGLGGAPAVDVLAVGAFGEPALAGRGQTGGGEVARVRQVQRSRRQDRLAFEIVAPGQQSRGERADGGMLSVSGPGGSVAVALDHMHRYEPQALRLLGDGRLAVDVADEHVWLAHHQGLFANMAVAALPDRPARGELDRLVWAPLNHPLRAWPDAAWFAGSGAVPEIPAGELPRDLAAFDEIVPDVLRLTVDRVDGEGLAGLMTYGVFPRYWGRREKGGEGEIRCKEEKDKTGKTKKRDPTPDESWDDTFWCSTWTDYHNTAATAPLWAMRSGEVEWLDDIAVPAALRTLHTQIMQCGPEERWFYCGQAPAGYAGYREDFNSSHAYFDNLYLYFWLTGDRTVPDTLLRGGENMRRLMCPSRGPQTVARADGPEGPACAAGEKLDKSSFNGRVGVQWLSAFRFLGLASQDATFLEDYRSGLERMLTHQYAELEQGGKTYGFLGGQVDPTAPGEAGPLWMNAFYDAEILYRWQLDSGDAPLGEPALRPSRVMAAVARTLAELTPRVAASQEDRDGKAGDKGKEGKDRKDRQGGLRSPWPQHLIYKFEGPRIGGRLVEVRGKGRDLFFPEKAGMSALLVRAGRSTGDASLLRAGREMVETVFEASQGEHVPLGKLQGQYLTRLHAAVGALAAPRAAPPAP